MTPLRRALTASLALLALSSCSMFQRQIRPAWAEGDVRSNSESVLYEVVHVSLQKAGYPVGVGADPGSREVVTGWYRSGAPFKGKGYRQRATVTYTPGPKEGSKGRLFTIRVRVQREINQSFRPLDPRYAEWEETEDNSQEARRILQYMRSFLAGGDLEVGPEAESPFE